MVHTKSTETARQVETNKKNNNGRTYSRTNQVTSSSSVVLSQITHNTVKILVIQQSFPFYHCKEIPNINLTESK